MLQQHVASGADITVSCVEVPQFEARSFGVMSVGANDRITHFLKKPMDPPTIPGRTNRCLASMGIYVFNTSFLIEQLRRDAATPDSSRDFGKDIIPHIIANGHAVAHRFSRS